MHLLACGGELAVAEDIALEARFYFHCDWQESLEALDMRSGSLLKFLGSPF